MLYRWKGSIPSATEQSGDWGQPLLPHGATRLPQAMQGPPAAPFTMDEGCGGGPVTLHLPAGAAGAGLHGHPLPLQDVGGWWGRGGLPAHPEAALTPRHSMEPSQGLTCMGTSNCSLPVTHAGRADGAAPSLRAHGAGQGERRPGGTRRVRAWRFMLPSPFLSSSTTSVAADSPAAL